MKKILWIELSLTACVSLVGCSTQSASPASANNLTNHTLATTTNRTANAKDKMTIDDINNYYANSAQPKSSILNIKSYSKYHAVIVESHINVPNLIEPDDFEWWDMRTGKHFVLVGRPTYAQLKQVISADEVVFLASGKNAETPEMSFPYYIYDKRTNTNSDFTPVRKPAYFPLENSFSFGDSKVEAVSKVTASTDSVEMNFAPLNNNGGFYAGSTGAPETNTMYLKNQNEMMLRFQKTKLTVNTAELQTLHNAFVQNVSAHMNGTELDVTLHLTHKAKFYTVSVDHSNHPSLTIFFMTQSQQLG